ncbi:MAG: glycosyltransferase family 9 protein [Candidatus Zixiibacteriota bacterium]
MPPKIIKHIEHLFKKALNLPFYIFLGKGDNSRIPINPDDVKAVLFLRPDKLGDMIATIPAMHAVKKHFPHIRVEVLASPRNYGMIINDPEIDKVHLYTKNVLKDLRTIAQLRKKDFDIVYDPICHDSTTGLILTKWIGKKAVHVASRKLGLRHYYDYCRPYEPDGYDHNIDNGLLIFESFGIDPETVDPFLPVYIPDESWSRANNFYSGLPADNHYLVGVNISAGSPTRTLPMDHYAKIINDINSKHENFRFIIFCVMDNRRDAQELIGKCDADARLIPENLSLLDVSAIMNRLDILVSPDTSMVHIAGTMRIPVVGLYSGHLRNFRFWRPYRQEFGAIVAGNIQNLFDIRPENVVEEFERLYNSINRDASPDRKRQ